MTNKKRTNSESMTEVIENTKKREADKNHRQIAMKLLEQIHQFSGEVLFEARMFWFLDPHAAAAPIAAEQRIFFKTVCSTHS